MLRWRLVDAAFRNHSHTFNVPIKLTSAKKAEGGADRELKNLAHAATPRMSISRARAAGGPKFSANLCQKTCRCLAAD